ncbi:DUF3159 domain-containing protein [Streptomyces cucumeris]|uniref:DUF3159 domain-containing protein n=1 Tax=Streptomyces cucumeris TaxID=2962890 RepID=UPI003D74EDAF
MTSATADGLRKTFDAGAPIAAFLVGHGLRGTIAGAAAAIAVALAIACWRLLHGRRIRLIGVSLGIVLIHSLFAYHTGEGRDFFLPDLLMNGVLTVAFGGSLLTGRPLTGLISRWSGSEVPTWYRDRDRLRLHRKLTLLWLGLWCLHLALLLPLYAADAVVALGVASLTTGKPAVLVCAVLSWRVVRRGAASPAPFSPAVATAQDKEPHS